MNLSNDTIAIFKNFANINQNILLNCKKLNTISTMKNILHNSRCKRRLYKSLQSMTCQS